MSFSRLRNYKNFRFYRKIQSTYDLSNIYEIMGSYFDSLKDQLKTIRNSQEFTLVQMGIEPKQDKQDVESEENENAPQKLSVNQNLTLSANKRYFSEDLERFINEDNLAMDSNKRFLHNE